VYTKGGVDGAEGEDDEYDDDDGGFTKKVSTEGLKKEISDKVDIFKKRTLFANDDAGKLNA